MWQSPWTERRCCNFTHCEFEIKVPVACTRLVSLSYKNACLCGQPGFYNGTYQLRSNRHRSVLRCLNGSDLHIQALHLLRIYLADTRQPCYGTCHSLETLCATCVVGRSRLAVGLHIHLSHPCNQRKRQIRKPDAAVHNMGGWTLHG